MSRNSRRFAVVSVLAAAAIALSACAPSGGAGNAPSGEPDTDASIAVGLILAPSNLDIRRSGGAAVEQLLVDNVYEGLVTRDQENNVIPRLASEYSVSDDGLTYTFTLQPDVTFHNGQTLTSADVVASYEAVKSDAAMQGNGDFQTVASIAAPSDDTVVITLTAPNQNFLFSLTGPGGLVFAADDTTNLQTAENGTGPFTVSDWATGTSATLTRYDDYWGEPAGVAEITAEYMGDFTAAVNAGLDGTLDVVTVVLPELASELEDSGDFTLTTGLTTDKATLAFNNAKAPFTDVRVREALRLAVDHDAIVEAFNGAGSTMYGPIPELDPGFEDLTGVADYDPERARELLAEAGQENLSITLTISNHYPTTIPQILVSDYAKVGVTLKVNSVPFETWFNDVYTNHDYDLSYVLHVEPRDFANFANPDYYFGYNNPEVQSLYAQALASLDEDEYASLLAQAARIVAEDHAADWLYNGKTITAVRPTISGFPENSTNARLPMAAVTVTTE